MKSLAVFLKDMRDTFRFDGTPYNSTDGQSMAGQPAMIAGRYGMGRVILSGPHPELGEEQVFMDWIFFLASGAVKKKTVAGSEPVEPSNPNQAVLKNFWSAIEAFEALAAPYATQILPFWKN